ncbi:hypothetical protein [Spirosoma radiotolerans]|uniref:HK97 gp10 family phage protein n=1 Tax=Spirosoma radiotolerans TaxID=1379870 RepID=A0A0E3ZU87_9BACT|nr:hypothetical protein [Spirosoma radiotolerans]AKD55028.1 hypothetical protein SD10_09045 [Spirosoma radiotolerans]
MVAEIVEFFMAPFYRVNIEQVVAETIDEHDDDIVELNLSQLEAGKTSEGNDIKPFYKPGTVKARKKEGLQTDHVDFKRKGGFYAGTFAKRTTGGTEISSTDPKAPFLIKRSGEGIFGLTVANRGELENRMRPTLQDKFKQALL